MDRSPPRWERPALIVAALLLAADIIARLTGVELPGGTGTPLHDPKLADFVWESLTEGATFVAAMFIGLCKLKRDGLTYKLHPEQVDEVVDRVTTRVSFTLRETPPPVPEVELEPATDEQVAQTRRWT